MCEAALHHGGYVIGIDIEKKHFVQNVLDSYPNFLFFNTDATRLETYLDVKTWCEEMNLQVGVIYQDSSHHYLKSKAEWNYFSRLLGKEYVWVADDITPAFHDPNIDPPGKGMVQYFEEINGVKNLYDDLHYGSIQGIVVDGN